MSAYVCSAKTIAVIAQNLVATFNVGVENGITPADFAENMLKLNLRSVGWHYHMTPAKACKEFTGKNMKAYTAEVREAAEQEYDKVGEGRLLGAVDCFIYQACEIREKDSSMVTFKTVQRYEKVLEALCNQKGIYSEGWDF